MSAATTGVSTTTAGMAPAATTAVWSAHMAATAGTAMRTSVARCAVRSAVAWNAARSTRVAVARSRGRGISTTRVAAVRRSVGDGLPHIQLRTRSASTGIRHRPRRHRSSNSARYDSNSFRLVRVTMNSPAPRDASLCDGGVNGRKPSRLAEPPDWLIRAASLTAKAPRRFRIHPRVAVVRRSESTGSDRDLRSPRAKHSRD